MFYSYIIENKWFAKEQNIKYRNSIEAGTFITINKDLRIIHKTPAGIKEYFDSRQTLNNVYDNVDDYYKEKLLKKNYKKALSYINDSLEIPIQNIWLKSSLLYFKGDLLIRLGKFVAGEIALKESIKLYPNNTDAFQRLT